MPEVGSWKQRLSGIFCHILLLSTIIKFIFKLAMHSKKFPYRRKSSFHVNVGVLRDTCFCYMCQYIYWNPDVKFPELEKVYLWPAIHILKQIKFVSVTFVKYILEIEILKSG